MLENNLQPTYKRQRFLLSFVRQLQGGVNSTDLQKLIFLYTMNENLRFYEFIPYKFGSYSFQLAEDIDILGKGGYLLIDGSRIQAIGEYPYESLFPIASERGDSLIRKAYREYPYYAINSEIISRLFNSEEAENFKCVKNNYAKTAQELFAIGYEGKSIEAFMNILIQNDIRLLCDVRKNPISRKFGFSKNRLEHITEAIGIKYIHLPNLGIESDKRISLETAEDYHRLFIEYKRTLSSLKPSLEQLYLLLRSNIRITLMCYEKEPEMCHRHVIRDYLTDTYEIRSIDL
ncbi:MAG: DUF488 domain-containing protein [Elusimicrobiota bacterium]|jgi:uncharacterized protein YwgA|nr:DUF488 domain-containing protein [Elusimicrobiota bacterium]